MKHLLILCVMTVFLAATPVYAEKKPVDKLGRGFVNIVTAPVEIPKQARASWIEGAQKTDHILVWIGTGAVWGFVQGAKRASSGLWDIVSFPFAVPEEYESIIQPGCVFDEWPRNPVSGR